MNAQRANGPRSGWILVETLVALVVLTVAVLAVNRAFGEAVLTRAIARDYTQARFFMEEVLGDLEVRPVHIDGAAGNGNFGEENPRFSYTWSVKKLPMDMPQVGAALPPAAQRYLEEFEMPVQYLGEITVAVSWTRQERRYTEEVVTIIAPERLVVEEEETDEAPE